MLAIYLVEETVANDVWQGFIVSSGGGGGDDDVFVVSCCKFPG